MINILREKFLNYHRDQGFGIYESFPLVINDPTILFTNATVTPFKSMFTSAEARKLCTRAEMPSLGRYRWRS